MDAGLTAVSTRRKRKADKMNSLRCRYMSHMFHCVCMCGGGGGSICCIFQCTDAIHTSGEDISAMAAHKASWLFLNVKQQKTWCIND